MSQQALVQGLQAANTATGVPGNGLRTWHSCAHGGDSTDCVTLGDAKPPLCEGLLVWVEFVRSHRGLTFVPFPKGFIPSV